MERREINSDNYEAFYLDYLEGNLSAEESEQLQSFLFLHPELEVDFNDVCPLLLTHNPPLQHDFKQGLKQVDFMIDPISEQNAEEFMIAYYEGLLNEKTSGDLLRYVHGNDRLQKLFQAYEHIRFKVKAHEIYPSKRELKRKSNRILPLIYLSGAAAAIIVLIFAYRFTNSTRHSNDSAITAQKSIDRKTNTKSKRSENTEGINTLSRSMQQAQQLVKVEVKSKKILLQPQRMNVEVQDEVNNCVLPFEYDNPPSESNEIAVEINVVSPQTEANSVVLASSTMNNSAKNSEFINPIFPVTIVLTNVLNKEVDFGTTRKEVMDNRGFYVKIGKFEISHNSSRASR